MHGCASPSAQRLAWRHIQLRGLSGLVPPREALAAIYAGDLLPEVACAVHADPKLEREVRLAIFEAAGPIRKFVERFEPGSESVWFANPPVSFAACRFEALTQYLTKASHRLHRACSP